MVGRVKFTSATVLRVEGPFNDNNHIVPGPITWELILPCLYVSEDSQWIDSAIWSVYRSPRELIARDIVNLILTLRPTTLLNKNWVEWGNDGAGRAKYVEDCRDGVRLVGTYDAIEVIDKKE